MLAVRRANAHSPQAAFRFAAPYQEICASAAENWPVTAHRTLYCPADAELAVPTAERVTHAFEMCAYLKPLGGVPHSERKLGRLDGPS